MANKTNAWGLRPVKHLNGSPWNGVTEKCYVGATYGTAMYIGDTVMINNASADSDPTAKFTSIERSAIADAAIIYGVIVSFDDSEGCSKVYNPASTERYVNVCVDPTVIYHIRGNGIAAPTRVTPFLNAIMVAGTASTVTGLSGIMLDEGTDPPAVDQTNPLIILRLANLPDNELAASAVYEVMINNHQLRAGAAGQVLGVTKA